MVKLEVTRKGETDQFSIVLSRGDDTIRCMVTVGPGHDRDAHSDQEKRLAALSKAKALARAPDEAIDEGSSEAL